MTLRDLAGTLKFKASNWVEEHNSEILWAAVFAAAVGILVWMISPPAIDPYKIVVVADHHTEPNTMNYLLNYASTHQPFRRIHDVKVEIEIDKLENDDEATVVNNARNLAHRPDVLMAIGHLPSQAAESFASVLLSVTPKIPFIVTVSSDGDLLSKCKPRTECQMEGQSAPFLQLSPTNDIEAHSAVTYATLRGKRKFLIAYDNDQDNASYALDLVKAFENEIGAFNRSRMDDPKKRNAPAVIVGEHKMDLLLSPQDIGRLMPDCILYAGGMGEGLSLLGSTKKLTTAPMIIFSDSTVQDGFSANDLKTFTGTLFTNQNDAVDYDDHRNVYVEDALAIAGQIVEGFDSDGGDLRLRLRTLAHLQNAIEVRRNIDRIITANENHWYKGSTEDTVYAFESGKRYGGMFHVWALRNTSDDNAIMDDVDFWHVPKGGISFSAVPAITTHQISPQPLLHSIKTVPAHIDPASEVKATR